MKPWRPAQPSHWILASALALLSLLALRMASTETGYVRDEAVYMRSSARLHGWLVSLVDQPTKALQKAARDKAFGDNPEHPALMKLLAAPGCSRASSHDAPDPCRPGPAMRWPAQLCAALGVFILALHAMSRFGPAIGCFCAIASIALPRYFYHAQLHAFDVPIAVAALAVTLAFVRWDKRPSLSRSLLLGMCWGLSLSIKHNAWLFAPLLALGWIVSLRGKDTPARLQHLFMGLLALLIGLGLWFALWPWLWGDPIARILDYFAFHRDHSYYNMVLGGQNYNQPPLPVAYPFVMAAATWPLSWLLLVLGGLTLCLRSWTRHQDHPRDSCELIMAMAPLVLIAWPSVPIFGGTKHWLTAYPFWCLLMGRALHTLNQRAKIPRTLLAGGLSLLLAPALYDNWRSAPLQLSQYASWVGGPRGAARMGLNRGFWGGLCVPQALGRLHASSKLYPHDTHRWLLSIYKRQGLAPDKLRATSRNQANVAFHFYETHFLHDELATLDKVGPLLWTCDLDDVPLMGIYGQDPPKTP